MLGRRYLDHTDGRFLTRDPGSYLGGINVYEYVGDNPINAIDPLGLFTIGSSDYPFLIFDSDTVGGGLATGTAAVASSLSFGLYDGGMYKCDPSFNTSLGLANFGRDTLLTAAAPGAEVAETEELFGGSEELLGDCLLCFPAGTPVQLADGTTEPVEDVQPGDRVASRDPDTGKDVAEPVLRTLERQADALVTVHLADAKTGAAAMALTCTPEHPLYVDGKGWVPAGALGIGTSIVTRAGPSLVVKSVDWQRAKGGSDDGGGLTVYNFEVQDTHSYFVGIAHGGAWVHNTNCALRYKAGWTQAQVAEADAKVAALNNAAANNGLRVITPNRISGLRRFFTGNSGNVGPGEDVDHIVDLQFGGTNTMNNLWALNRSVNRSLGAQIANRTTLNQIITNFTIGW